jgi:hypothetical protein
MYLSVICIIRIKCDFAHAKMKESVRFIILISKINIQMLI